ncbi:MAG: hypothetical protein MHPSP_002109 [Paramarteilia canceri]
MEDYFDCENFLAGCQIVQVNLTKSLEGVSFFKSNKDECDLVEKGSKLDLPLWLAKDMEDNSVGKMKLPIYLTSKMLDTYSIDEHKINLSSFSADFFLIASELRGIVDKAMQMKIKSLFAKRINMLSNMALAIDSNLMGLKMLEKCEENMVKVCQKSYKDLKKWESY